jgi:uncharacterized protein (TIGR03435 family)
MKLCWAGIVLLSLIAVSHAQIETAPKPRFEVTVVKPCTGQAGLGRGGRAAAESLVARIDLGCQSVKSLIAMAYFRYADAHDNDHADAEALRENRIQGGPSWMNSDLYRIDAKAEGTPNQAMMLGPMVQMLLEDRFRMKFHIESKEASVYVLTVGKGGPKLQMAKEGTCTPLDIDHLPSFPKPGQPLPKLCGQFSGDYIYGTSIPMLCRQLSFLLGRPIIDKTAISGVFDIYLDSYIENIRPLTPDGTPAPIDPSAPPPRIDPDVEFRAALISFRKLGLDLAPKRDAISYFIVDQIERPGEN